LNFAVTILIFSLQTLAEADGHYFIQFRIKGPHGEKLFNSFASAVSAWCRCLLILSPFLSSYAYTKILLMKLSFLL